MCRLTEMKLYNSTVSVMLTVEMCVQTDRGELYGCDSDHGDVCAD